MIIGSLLAFNVLCWVWIAWSLSNAPTDVELWGKEVE